MNAITLNEGQKNAYNTIMGFIGSPSHNVLVLSGFAGTGKSTLMNEVRAGLPKVIDAINLIRPGNEIHFDIEFTATTNKATEALADVLGEEVKTIQSSLGLIVKKDYKTNQSQLTTTKRTQEKINSILFIDEASFIDAPLLELILKLTQHSKVIFIGDPAQLTHFNYKTAPVFDRGFPEVRLEQIMRQGEGNPIIDLSAAFRNTVMGQPFFSFVPDQHHIQRLSDDDFKQAMMQEFSRSDWHYSDSKILAWTNKTVIQYNKFINDHLTGTPELVTGDYAVCNEYIQGNGCSFKTDALVQITSVFPTKKHGVDGYQIGIENRFTGFMPKHLDDKKNRIKVARKAQDDDTLVDINRHWIDLRAAYACTINKSQGSTYKKVFIDLDDVSKCNIPNQMARMLYVAVSRASDQVIFKGDLV